MQYLDWFERDGVYYRCPNHLNPVRRSLAIRAGFPARSFREDLDYSLALRPLLRSEVFLEGPVYFYEFCAKKRGIFGLW